MRLLIDGYNLLHVAPVGLVGGDPTLEASRQALLDYVASLLDASERMATTIVFDGRSAPPGLPRAWVYREMQVRFAPRQSEADALIEELVDGHDAPRRLTVVSSDHRVQRAARRRRSKALDSDIWLQNRLVEQRARRASGAPAAETPKQSSAPLSPEEVARWMAAFGEE